MFILYHNPRCSKSRACLQLLQKTAVPIKVIDYMHEGLALPLLQQFVAQLGLRTILRQNEVIYKELKLGAADEQTILEAIIAYPQLLQRPIVVLREKIIVARPPEKVLELMND
jgi:arsenate reductase